MPKWMSSLSAMARRRWRWLAAGMLLAAVTPFALFWVMSLAFPFPIEELRDWPASPRVTDREGRVMMQKVNAVGQWRFPVKLDEVSPWLVQATLAVEDERFMSHPGVDPIAVVRAGVQNARAGRVVSGASTLTMQVSRLMRERDGRTARDLHSKLIESFRALQLEQELSKVEILETYLNITPYGGNFVGVAAASDAYFAKSPENLSLGEAALLAGLPQSPARYQPVINADAASARRTQVLMRMRQLEMITDEQMKVAQDEPMPTRIHRHGLNAPQAAWMALNQRATGGQTTLDLELQGAVERILRGQIARLPEGTDGAAVVIDVATGEIRALVGSPHFGNPKDGQVNGVLARRSPGSTLKPFIYAAAFETGRFGPKTLVNDAPINRAGWTPANFSETFAGTLPAEDALRRSLNVPAILVAEATGLSRCVGVIERAGVDLPSGARSQSGLAFVVGSAEVTLLDLTNGYATLARGGIYRNARLFADDGIQKAEALHPSACETVNDILSTRHRMPRSLAKRDPRAVPWFMWKTGTSAARRDAWAVGHNYRYAVGVWIGRFSGEPRPEFVGERAAEPALAAMMTLPEVASGTVYEVEVTEEVQGPIHDPLILAARKIEGPYITSPRNGAVFLAPQGKAIVQVRYAQAEDAKWFLNEQLIEQDEAQRMELEPGSYELRVTNMKGEYSCVKFQVRPG